MRWIKISAAIVLALAWVGSQSPEKVNAEVEEFKLTVLHTNDTHARLENASKRASLVKQIRAEQEHTLLLDAGDVFSGTLYFNKFSGQADIKLMNYLKYDAMTLGNHELDQGVKNEDLQATREFISGAEFPLLSANVDFSKEKNLKDLLNADYTGEYTDGEIYKGIIKEIDGEKVGIFGLTTAEATIMSDTGNVEITNYIEAAEEAVNAFKKQGVNKIIALTHLGYNDNPKWDNDLELARAVEGIDIIVGGHSHTDLNEPTVVEFGEEPTIIVHTDGYDKSLGRLDVKFDQNGKLTSHEGRSLRYDFLEIEPDQEAEGLLAPFRKEVERISKESIGVSNEKYLHANRMYLRRGTPHLGNLVADSMLYSAQKINLDVTIALTNAGSIQDSIDEGDITLGEVLRVLPYGNRLAIMELSGAELLQVIEHSVEFNPEYEFSGFLQVAGIKVKFFPWSEPGNKVFAAYTISDKGLKPLNPEETYYVATNSFTAKGGDGYNVFKTAYEDGRVMETDIADYQMFIDYLKRHGQVPPASGSGFDESIEMPFTDVKPKNEFAPYIQEIYSSLIKGTTPTTYSPNRALTRAQAASLITRLRNLDIKDYKDDYKTSSFKDLGNMAEETKAEISAAQEAGLIKGMNGNFMPYEPVKRSQLALMLMRMYENYEETDYTPLKPAPFNDLVRLDEEAKEAVTFLYENGIAHGSENETIFRPAEPTTRAQAAKIFYNYRNWSLNK